MSIPEQIGEGYNISQEPGQQRTRPLFLREGQNRERNETMGGGWGFGGDGFKMFSKILNMSKTNR